MARRRPQLRALAATLLVGSLLWGHGCGIDLTDELAGRPCKDGRCLPGYVCAASNVCVLDTGAGGDAGEDGSVEASEGAGGTGTEGDGGEAGKDARDDVSDGHHDAPDVSTGGSAGTAGSAGSSGSSGSSGTAGSAGTAGTAGSAGTAGTAGSDGGANPWPGTGCRQLTCGASAVCCVGAYPGFPEVPPATAFSCKAPNPAPMCAFTLLCDGDHDCPRGQQCCIGNTAGGWFASCADSCTAPDYRLQCTKREHCGTGLVCCGDWQAFTTNRFERVTCRPACNEFDDRAFCSSNADCSGGQTCREAASVPGFQVCQ